MQQLDSSTDLCPGRGKHDKEGRQRALVEAAVAVFAEHGFQAATTREVAERARCAEGLIHRYFGGKQGLLLAALEEHSLALSAGMAAALPPASTVEEELEQYILHAIEGLWPGKVFRRAAPAGAFVAPAVAAFMAERFCDLRARFIRERLEAHQAAGRIGDGADID